MFFMMVRKLYIYFSSSQNIRSCNGIQWKIICKFLDFFFFSFALTGIGGAGRGDLKDKRVVYGIVYSGEFGSHLE